MHSKQTKQPIAKQDHATWLEEEIKYLQQTGKFSEGMSFHLLRKHLDKIISDTLRENNVVGASRFAMQRTALSRGSRWSSSEWPSAFIPEKPFPDPQLTEASLRHSIEQFAYLRSVSLLKKDELDEIIVKYRRMIDALQHHGKEIRSLDHYTAKDSIGSTYGRLIYLRPTPSLHTSALSKGWNKATVQSEYINNSGNFVIIDNFLSPLALKELRHFCLESTIWFQNRYKNGRLGAFFRDGFNCPLLLQINDEIRSSLPHIIKETDFLLQLWAFKYLPSHLSAAAHADFAKVNVNLWITPDSANLDKDSGGLLLYPLEAPADWDFDSYNNNGEKITQFISKSDAQCISIPYRENRAVIFNSRLFHQTAPIEFLPGYENRRINITFLYGTRET